MQGKRQEVMCLGGAGFAGAHMRGERKATQSTHERARGRKSCAAMHSSPTRLRD
jgi:hypothetical protein